MFVSTSHCITGSGFPGQLADGDEDDSLSPEACYECKINGGGKNGRHRRHTDKNELNQEPMVSMASVDTQTSIPMNVSLSSLLNKEPLLELLPALQPLEHHVRYVITHGNANEHFRLLERRDGKSVLRLGKRPPSAGSYRLEIASLPLFGPRRMHQLEEQHDRRLPARGDRRSPAHQAPHPPALSSERRRRSRSGLTPKRLLTFYPPPAGAPIRAEKTESPAPIYHHFVTVQLNICSCFVCVFFFYPSTPA
ncbi:fibrillin-2-like [Amphiprion ocellaris]|uniref:fibrillin-2-like n=1 Tax=Amphiprion ocellaris TaxID=80972 RepID=UPI002411997D|nr:fibrillin-2-like [Amphiprion ocellaris]